MKEVKFKIWMSVIGTLFFGAGTIVLEGEFFGQLCCGIMTGIGFLALFKAACEYELVKSEELREKEANKKKVEYFNALEGTDKALALKLGREYYGLLRKDGRVTTYDEQAITNDLSSMKVLPIAVPPPFHASKNINTITSSGSPIVFPPPFQDDKHTNHGKILYCQNCGQSYLQKENVKFCNQCGNKL